MVVVGGGCHSIIANIMNIDTQGEGIDSPPYLLACLPAFSFELPCLFVPIWRLPLYKFSWYNITLISKEPIFAKSLFSMTQYLNYLHLSIGINSIHCKGLWGKNLFRPTSSKGMNLVDLL